MLVSKSFCNRAKLHYKIPDCFLERKILWIHFGDCESNIFHCLGGEDTVFLVCFFLGKFKSQTRLLKTRCVNKWCSDEEQLAWNVGSQSILLPSRVVIAKSQIFRRICYRKLLTVWDRPHSRWQILIFHFVFGFGGDPYYVCWTKVTITWVVFWFPPDKGNGIWHEPFTNPARSLTHII